MSERILDKALVVINENECKGCEMCVDVCQPKVLKISGGLNRMGYHPMSYLGQGCTGCGVCFYACPEPGAITVFKKGHVEYVEAF